jgi:uncharacterized membrane protein YgcG
MSYIFIKKIFLIFILTSIISFSIWPAIIFAQNFDEISPEEIKEYLELPEKDAQNLMESLPQILTSEGINLLSSGYSTDEEIAAILTLRKGARVQMLNHLLIDAPIEITGKIIEYTIEMARIFLAEDIVSTIWDRLEKESVKRAVEYGMKALLQNEIRVTPGTLSFSYPSYKGNQQNVVFQYLMIYRPIDEKHGNVVIRIYSSTSIEPPKSSPWLMGGVYHELTHDLAPFIIEINGSLEDFGWIGNPSIKVTFPEQVPDLGIKPLGFFDRNVLDPIKNGLEETILVFKKIFGKTAEGKDKIQTFGEGAILDIENALNAIKAKTENLWNKFEETVSQFNPFGAAASFFSQFDNKKTLALESSLSETESELEKLRSEISLLEEKLKVEESLKKELKEKYESDLNEISNEVNDFTARLDTFSQQINEFNQKPSEESTKPKSEEAKTEIEETTFCQRKEGDLPKGNKIIFNEVSWMGTENSSNDEWIELKNISGAGTNLAGWQLLDKDGQIKIIFSNGEQFSANGFYLLERTDDNSVPNVSANKIYTGALNDTNETLYLFNENCELEDEILANPNWPAGDKDSKRTMERKSDLGWQTSANIGGTPKSENSSGNFFVASGGGSSGGGSSGTGTTTGGGGSSGGTSPPPPKFGIIINEIQIEGQTSKDEFIELYNLTNQDVNLSSFSLKKKTSTGSESNLVSSDKFSGTISTGGYLLIVPQPKDDGTPNYQGTVPPDLFYSGKTYSIAANNTVLLYDSNSNLIDKVGFGNAKDFEGNVFPKNPEKGQSLGREWLEESQNYQDTNDNQEDFEIQNPTPKSKNQTIEESGSPFEIIVSGADTVWNLNLTTASADVKDSTDAPPQDLAEVFVSHADIAWNLDCPTVSLDIIDSTDAPPQVLPEAFISGSETTKNINLEKLE